MNYRQKLHILFETHQEWDPEKSLGSKSNFEADDGLPWGAVATDTHYGRGGAIDPHTSIERVIDAFNAVHSKPVSFYEDEDAYLFPVEGNEDFMMHFTDQEFRRRGHLDIAKTPEEAVRLWWNGYGHGSDEVEDAEVIYNDGKGPHGIGDFAEPWWLQYPERSDQKAYIRRAARRKNE